MTESRWENLAVQSPEQSEYVQQGFRNAVVNARFNARFNADEH